MTISLGSLGSLTGSTTSPRSPDFRTRLSINQPTSASGTATNASEVAYSTRALAPTASSIDRKASVLDSQINEVNRLIDIAEEIQSGRYDDRSNNLRSDASARLSAAISAYETAAENTPSLEEDEEQLVNTSVNYDPNDTEDAVIVTISATSSPEDAGLEADLFDESSYSIEETITALENAKTRFESERAALGSTSTAVSAADANAQLRTETIEASQSVEEQADPSEVIKEQTEQILADSESSEASIASDLATLIGESTDEEDEDEISL